MKFASETTVSYRMHIRDGLDLEKLELVWDNEQALPRSMKHGTTLVCGLQMTIGVGGQ